MEAKNLKLIAKTEEDLRVVSAHLQDAIVNVSDVANLKKNKIFLIQLNTIFLKHIFFCGPQQALRNCEGSKQSTRKIFPKQI